MYQITEVTDYKGSTPHHWYMGDKVMMVDRLIDRPQIYQMAFDVQIADEEDDDDNRYNWQT